MLVLEPYWGKLTVRNFRGGDEDVGIIRSPVRAIALLDHRFPLLRFAFHLSAPFESTQLKLLS
jgi:hypothetical protein